MYGRGARVLTQPALSTAPGVGPGTYRVENGGKHPGGIYVARTCYYRDTSPL